MEKLLETLQIIIEQYDIADSDVALIQEALSELENGADAEFDYSEAEPGEANSSEAEPSEVALGGVPSEVE